METDPIPPLPSELKQHLGRYKAPPGLERRLRQSLARERPSAWSRLWASFNRAAPLVASFAGGAFLASALWLTQGAALDAAEVEQQVVASHVRSLMADHLTDVASSDRHTVKPWFTGKLDFAPPVVDLAAQGFPLVGGRLDYVQERPVAALVYQRHGHTINVFVMPTREARFGKPRAGEANHGYAIEQWQAGGMRFWAVSDLGADELRAFAALLKAAL
jgi:anti-sigma factor RsiW